MKKIFSRLFLFTFVVAAGLFSSCSSAPKKTSVTNIDTTPDSALTKELNDSVHIRFRQLVAELPVPGEVLQKLAGAHIPFQAAMLNPPQNVSSYTTDESQAMNLGVYGADFAYMIAEDKLGDAGQYLKSIHQIADNIVIPTAFDENLMKRYRDNSSMMDSMGSLVSVSYRRIDSTLQGNERINLAALVISSGWIESLYITTQQIGDETQNKNNKVLFDMLAEEQPHLTHMIGLLGSFHSDSTCMKLSGQLSALKKLYPPGANIPPDQFSAQVKKLRDATAGIRNSIIHIQ